jgi:hypothetical protein
MYLESENVYNLLQIANKNDCMRLQFRMEYNQSLDSRITKFGTYQGDVRRANLSSLTPFTDYHVRVVSVRDTEEQPSAWMSFKTAEGSEYQALSLSSSALSRKDVGDHGLPTLSLSCGLQMRSSPLRNSHRNGLVFELLEGVGNS